jgi:hypothetical protein
VGDLGGAVEGDPVAGRLGAGDHGPWLDGVRDQTLLDVALLDHHVGPLERAVDVPHLERPQKRLVAPEVLVDQGRIFFERFLHVHDCVERLVVNLDEL